MSTSAVMLKRLFQRKKPETKVGYSDPQPAELDPSCVIQTKGLRKEYGTVVAVKGLDLSVRSGEVIGLLGPNGSGKTTTILMLVGLTEPTGGWARVFGLDPLRNPLSVKRRVGYMPDSIGFYDHLTAVENLDYTAMLAGLDYTNRKKRIAEVLNQLELSNVADKKVSTFSRGMRQRLGLAEVLIKNPGIIILDEPTSGLDPEAAREFLAIIRSLKNQGIAILLSSHLLHQVQAICDRVLLFYKGEIVLEGSVHEITKQVIGGTYMFTVLASGPDAGGAIAALPGALKISRLEGGKLIVEADRDIRAEISRTIIDSGAHLLGLSDTQPTLDDVYARYFDQLHASTIDPHANSLGSDRAVVGNDAVSQSSSPLSEEDAP
ncbi:MAG: ABC transporter ATP-binding protein [Rectinema subterraneum]|uniref:ABC transporter ATP-binding protein n=1 Tax=Rectinema subterraneum TaxID=2653714 RepID=UPI003C7A9594